MNRGSPDFILDKHRDFLSFYEADPAGVRHLWRNPEVCRGFLRLAPGLGSGEGSTRSSVFCIKIPQNDLFDDFTARQTVLVVMPGKKK